MRRIVCALGLALVCLAVAALSACGSGAPAGTPVATPDPVVTPLPALAPAVLAARGQIVESHPFPTLSDTLSAASAKGVEMVYRTASGRDGGAREASGVVFVPRGTAPAGGWPIVSYGHGTTGLGSDCGPSSYPNLLGYDEVVASLLRLGFVVTMSDYEGLGHAGTHPYLEPKTEAFDLIDAVRAARRLVPDTSADWFAAGVSQGGQAAWAANELADVYGDGLSFRGSASLSPVSDLSGIAALAQAHWLSPAQQMLLPMLLAGIAPMAPDLRSADYLHGPLARDSAMWLACRGDDVARRADAVATLTGADSQPVSDAATAALRRALARLAVPQRRASGPMIIVTGDQDDVSRLSWVRKSVRAACALGDKVQFVVDPGGGHDDPHGGNYIGKWLVDMRSGRQAPDTCASL